MDYCEHWSGQIRVDTWLDLRGTVGDPQDSTPTTKTDIGTNTNVSEESTISINGDFAAQD